MKSSKTLFLSLYIIGSATLWGQKVHTDWDKEVDFSQYQTYKWAEGTDVPNPLNHQRLVNAVENQLAIKGLQQVETDADLYVSYHASAKEDVTFDTTHYGYGGGYYRGGYWGGGMGSSTTRAYTWVKGTVVLDFWDPKTEQLVWRGTATATVDENPKKNEKTIHKAVEKMFKKFPPKK